MTKERIQELRALLATTKKEHRQSCGWHSFCDSHHFFNGFSDALNELERLEAVAKVARDVLEWDALPSMPLGKSEEDAAARLEGVWERLDKALRDLDGEGTGTK